MNQRISSSADSREEHEPTAEHLRTVAHDRGLADRGALLRLRVPCMFRTRLIAGPLVVAAPLSEWSAAFEFLHYSHRSANAGVYLITELTARFHRERTVAGRLACIL